MPKLLNISNQQTDKIGRIDLLVMGFLAEGDKMKKTFGMGIFLAQTLFWLISTFVYTLEYNNNDYGFLGRAFLTIFSYAVFELLKTLSQKHP